MRSFVAGGLKYWHKAGSDDSTRPVPVRWRPPYRRARSFDIEMTAYALLTYTRLRDFSGAVPIAKWIVAQRNSRGGFSSTQVHFKRWQLVFIYLFIIKSYTEYNKAKAKRKKNKLLGYIVAKKSIVCIAS